MLRLLDHYKKHVVPSLKKEFGIKNAMAVPRIVKVVVNVGTGRVHKDDKILERVSRDLAMITGQRPAPRASKKSIASFKVRQGAAVGSIATMRGPRMWDFIDRLISLALPLSKDFRGIEEKNIDTHGNLNLGIKEHSIFPEVTLENMKDIFSLQITVNTTAKNHAQGVALLRSLGFPIKS